MSFNFQSQQSGPAQNQQSQTTGFLLGSTSVSTAGTPGFGGGQNLFGGTSTNQLAFGQTAPSFGQSTSAFGGQAASVFGQSTAPVFGQTTAPFGLATSNSGQTTTTFGQTTPAFGQSTAPFGQAVTTSSGFNFGIPGSVNTGFGFSSQPATTSTLSFGTTTTPSVAVSVFGSSGNVGSGGVLGNSGFGFGPSATTTIASTTQPSATTAGFGFAGFTTQTSGAPTYGTPTQPKTGLNVTTPVASSTTPSFHTGTTNLGTFSSTGFSLGTSTTSAAALPTADFNFTSTPASSITPSQLPNSAFGSSAVTSTVPNLAFGSSFTNVQNIGTPTTSASTLITPSKPTSGFTVGLNQSTTANSALPAFGISTTSGPASTSIAAITIGTSFGTPTIATTTKTPGFNFGTTQTSAAGFANVSAPSVLVTTNSGTVVTSIAPTSAIIFGTTTASTGFNFGKTTTTAPTTNTATTTTQSGFQFGKTAFGTPASNTVTTGLTSAKSIAPAATSAAGVTTTISTVTTTVSCSGTTLNFRQLEESINKWTLELEEHEKIFLNQATQVNAWDRLLINNGEMITQLNDSLERVKLDQQRLDHELDFILAQQRELEELITPLERSLEQTPIISVQQHADIEREHTYQLAENIDAQLKCMAEDLKEIIDHLNATNNNQDNNDLIYQVGKILNAHMDSLQWVEQNTLLVQRKLEEVTRLYEVRRKDQERRFKLAYD